MSHILTMNVCYSLQYLFNHLGSCLFTEIFALHDFIEKFNPVTQLRYQVQASFALENFIKLYDVWMRQVFQDVDLKFKTDMFLVF